QGGQGAKTSVAPTVFLPLATLGAYPAEQGTAPDRLQRPLLRRSRFRRQVSASVRQHFRPKRKQKVLVETGSRTRSYADVFSAGRRCMSIDEQGFLSDDIVQYRDQIRQRYAQYFDLIHRVNAFCQEAKFRINGMGANAHNLMAVRLIIKLLADTQGAVLLVER